MGSDIVKNILSFGAHGRVQDALESFRKIESGLNSAHHEVEQQRLSTNASLNRLIETKLAAIERLKLLSNISKNLGVRERRLTEGTIGNIELGTPLRDIETTLNSAEIAKNMAKGTSVGLSTALGTWALVGTLGSASTGTAIATLSGAAATNATLAWLGGGALAAGGGGMAAGAVVLGGIVLLPALAIMGIFSHVGASKKIAEIQEAGVKAIKAIAVYKQTLLSLNALQRRGDEVSGAVERSGDVYEREYHSAYSELFPWGIFSKVRRAIRRIVGRPFFNEQDLHVIAPMLQMAAALAQLVDTKLLNEEGGII
jgi:hypothetical protein